MTALETERLLIRNFDRSDWEALHTLIVQYEKSPYAIYDQPWPTAPEDIRGVTEWFASGDRYQAVCLKETGEFIGFVALNPEGDEEQGEFNIGYVFNADHHGKGYAGEACRVLLCHAFTQLHALRVVTGTAAANLPSCRLLERLGFKKTGESQASFRKDAEGKPVEFTGNSYALTKDEWEELSKPLLT